MRREVSTDAEALRTVSVTLARTLLYAFFIALAVQSPILLLFQSAGLPFSSYTIVGSVASVGAVAAFFLRRGPAGSVERDVAVSAALVGLCLLCAALAVCTRKPEADDMYYVPNAVHFMASPRTPMDFAVHYFRGQDNTPIVSYNQGTSMAYDYARAIAARLLGADYLFVYYILSVGVAGFLIPLAWFLLIQRLRFDPTLALAGALSAVASLLILTESYRSPGSVALPRIYQGKALVLSLAVPAYAAFSLEYLERPTVRRWIGLALIVAAATGMNSSACILFPILAACLASGVAAGNSAVPHGRVTLTTTFRYLATTIYAFAYAAFIYFQIRVQQNAEDPFSIVFESDTLAASASLLTSPDRPLTPIIIGTAFIIVLWLGGSRIRHLIGVWVLTLTLLFLNPIAHGLMAGRVIPDVVYWRIFYLYPGILVTGLATVLVFGRNRRGAILAGTGLLLVATAVYVGALRPTRFGRPAFKIPPRTLRTAQAVVKAAPAGAMLAPRGVADVVPMLEPGHPQLVMRKDAHAFWLEPEEQAVREAAGRFAGGEEEGRDAFVQLLRRGVADVVVVSVESREQADVRPLLTAAGYTRTVLANGHLVAWRASADLD